jgi:hypothetical protein
MAVKGIAAEHMVSFTSNGEVRETHEPADASSRFSLASALEIHLAKYPAWLSYAEEERSVRCCQATAVNVANLPAYMASRSSCR